VPNRYRLGRYGDRGLADRSLSDRAYGVPVSGGGGGGDISPPSIHLLNSLISYWKLDEASGTRADSQGTNNLSVTGSPVGVSSVINNGMQLNGSGQYALATNNASLQVSGDFTFSFWIRFHSLVSDYLIAKWDGVNNEYVFYFDSVSGFNFGVNLASVIVGSLPALNAWSHVVGWYDSSDQKVRLRINDANTYVGSSTSATIQAATNFAIGIRSDLTTPTVNADFDEIGFWKRKLNAAEITQLYNSGSGWPFSSFTS